MADKHPRELLTEYLISRGYAGTQLVLHSEEELIQMARVERQKQKEGDGRYQYWLSLVNIGVEGQLGVSLDDLPDMDTRALFDEGVNPGRAAQKLIARARKDYDF